LERSREGSNGFVGLAWFTTERSHYSPRQVLSTLLLRNGAYVQFPSRPAGSTGFGDERRMDGFFLVTSGK